MYRKSVLNIKPRIQFDPANRQHQLDFAEFIKYNNWRTGCRFLLEDPYEDIPSMIKDKLVEYYMKDMIAIL